MVNESYFGNRETWFEMSPVSTTNFFKVKVPDFNNTDTTNSERGAMKYKWGADFAETGEYRVNIDRSFSYIAMDKNAPCLDIRFLSAQRNVSASDGFHPMADISIKPDNNTAFGWGLQGITNWGGSQAANVTSNGTTWGYAPVNYKPVWYNPVWVPQTQTSFGKTALLYSGCHIAPVLSFPYRNIKLVPVVRCYAFKPDKTFNDLLAAETVSDITQILDTTGYSCDLKQYLDGTVSGVPTYEKYPVISSIAILPILLYFDENGNLANAPGTNEKYNGTATGNLSQNRGIFMPVFMNNNDFSFTTLLNYSTKTPFENAKMSGDFIPFPTRGNYNTFCYCENGTKSISISGLGLFTVSGSPYGISYANQQTAISPMLFDSGKYHNIFINSGNYQTCVFSFTNLTEFEENENFREYARKICAYFGMFFSDGVYNDIPETDEMNTNGVMLGVVDNNGITHGQYTAGAENETALNYEWTDPPTDTPTGGGGDSEIPSDSLTLNTNAVSGFGVAANYYALRYTDVDDITNYINYYMSYENAESAAIAAGNPYEQWFNDKFKTPADWYSYVFSMAGFGVHPNNDIISLMAFPFELSGTDTGYKLGSWETNVYHNNFGLLPDTPLLTGKQITGDGFKIVNLGSGIVTFPGVHGDFRDYAPYTRLELQIPYHGTAQLDTGEWLDKEISIQAIVDLMTGASLAIVCRDNAPVMTIPGQMGVSVPLSVDNVSQTSNTFNALSTQAQSTFINTVASIFTGVARSAGAVAGAVGSGLTGNLPGVVSGAFGALGSEWGMIGDFLKNRLAIKQNAFDMEHTVNGKLVSGGGVPNVNAKYETKCRLVWHYPQTIPGSNPENFPGVVGHACNVTGIVNDFSGYLECSAVDTAGIPCTETEKTMIATALKSGVFV